MHDSTAVPDGYRFGLWLAIAIVVVYVFLAWPGLHGPFVFDDMPNLGALAKAGPIDSWQALGIYLSEARGFPGRPLAMLSFVPQQGDWPGNPFPFKLVNLALHLVNAGLAFVLFRQLARGALEFTPGRAAAAAALLAAAWLAHPMQLSTVLLAVQRMTLLATLFILVGLLCYHRGLMATQLSATARGAWMLAGIAGAGVLAILCKETGALLPLYALVLDATLLRPHVAALPTALKRWRAILLYSPLVLLAAYVLAYQPGLTDVIATRDFTVGERLMTECRVLFDYLGKIAVPSYAQYGVYHDDYFVSRGLLSPWTTAPAIAGVIAALAVAFWTRKSLPLLALAVFWFVGGHVLESGPVPLELYFEHRNYLPMLGLLAALTFGYFRLPEGTWRRLATIVAGLWLAGCLFATALYAQVWSDPAKLAYFWAAEHPLSARAQGDFAESLFRAGMVPPARDVLATAAARRPENIGLEMSVLFIDCMTGNANPAQVQALRVKARSAPWSGLAYQSLASLQTLVVDHRCNAMDDANWLAMSDAFLANPAYRADRVAMGNLHYQRHSLAVARGQLSKAIEELESTSRFDPDPEIVRLQAKYLAQAGLRDEGIRILRDYDASTRPLIRRLLVDDVAINREHIRTIEGLPVAATVPSPPGDDK